MSENKELTKTLGTITEKLSSIQESMQSIAITAMVNTIYTKDIVHNLIEEYQSLHKLDDEACNELNRAHEELKSLHGDSSWNQRVEKYGKEVATEQNLGITQTMEARKETMAAFDKFCKEHHLIAKLIAISSKAS